MKRILLTPLSMFCCLTALFISTTVHAQTKPKDGQKVTITIETKEKDGTKSTKTETHDNENLSDADIDNLVDGIVKENEGKDVKVNVEINEDKAPSNEKHKRSKVIISKSKSINGDGNDDVKIIVNGKELKIDRDSSGKKVIVIDTDKDPAFFNFSPNDMFKSWGVDDSVMGNINGYMKGLNGKFFGEGHKTGFLGVTESNVKSDINGFIIGSIVTGSPAEKAGLKEGDIISSIAGNKIASFSELRTEIIKHKPGAEVEIVYTRDGKETTIKVALGENKDSYAFEGSPRMYEFNMPDIPEPPSGNFEQPYMNQDFNWHEDHRKAQLGVQVSNNNGGGVVVTSVIKGTAAYFAGIHEGDIIKKIGKSSIDKVEELVEKIQSYDPGEEVKVQLVRDGKKKTVDVVLGRQKSGSGLGYSDPETRKKKTYVFNRNKNDNNLFTDAGELKLENLDIFPNPSDGKVNVRFHSPSKSDAIVKVVDVTGKVLYTEDIHPFSGDYNKTLELNNTKNGVYVLRIEQDGKLTSEKLIMNGK
ncbi:MAG TPA: PDZ domain-containing protein [Saprospiraceae bacterium]|nr:PDZ domain-containing protein [Saprospiraceae bacterium]